MEIEKTQHTISKYSIWLMIITSIHHLYGAYIYHTPERFHVLAISIPVIFIILYFDRHFNKRVPPYRVIPIIIYTLIVFVPVLLMIGVLEGIYNHIVKNILYFTGVSEDTIVHTFYGFYDPEIIELPNDVFFELTGVAQGFLTIPIAKYFVNFMRYQFIHFSRKDAKKVS